MKTLVRALAAAACFAAIAVLAAYAAGSSLNGGMESDCSGLESSQLWPRDRP